MRVVTNQELSSFKILPFDVYNELNQKVLSAGEVLTPGKLIILKNYSQIYTEEFSNNTKINKSEEVVENDVSDIQKLANFSFETLDAADFDTVINRDNILPIETQVKIKYFYKKTLDLFNHEFYAEGLVKLNSLVNLMLGDIFKKFSASKRGSQVRYLGEYEICHPLNVATVSGLIAKRLEYSNQKIEKVILAALLHDIGKLKINLDENSSTLIKNEEVLREHSKLGYDLIKNTLHLSEEIARAVLEHHENNDGSGYPQGLSSDYISEIAQIINVANYYDNIACNRFSIPVASNRDALRAMLDIGTKRFAAKALYTFIHMFTYDDGKEFNDMII